MRNHSLSDISNFPPVLIDTDQSFQKHFYKGTCLEEVTSGELGILAPEKWIAPGLSEAPILRSWSHDLQDDEQVCG
jgi:hypothetical protein